MRSYELGEERGVKQGSRKQNPWDPVGLDKTYLVGQKEISMHGRSDTTHSRLGKLTADGTNCLKDTAKLSTINNKAKAIGAKLLLLNLMNKLE